MFLWPWGCSFPIAIGLHILHFKRSKSKPQLNVLESRRPYKIRQRRGVGGRGTCDGLTSPLRGEVMFVAQTCDWNWDKLKTIYVPLKVCTQLVLQTIQLNHLSHTAFFKFSPSVAYDNCELYCMQKYKHFNFLIFLLENITLKNTPAYGFVTECFFMTHHCLNLG